MKLGVIAATSQVLNAIGLALIIVSVFVTGATVTADDPGGDPNLAPRCVPVGGVCVEHNCPQQIPHCDIPQGAVNCTCH
jgi:hypothetical protein